MTGVSKRKFSKPVKRAFQYDRVGVKEDEKIPMGPAGGQIDGAGIPHIILQRQDLYFREVSRNGLNRPIRGSVVHHDDFEAAVSGLCVDRAEASQGTIPCAIGSDEDRELEAPASPGSHP